MSYLNRENGYEPTGMVNGAPIPEIVEQLFSVALGDIWPEFKRAVAKHGFYRTPASPVMPDGERLKILVEEVGEIARAMTYDEGDTEKLEAELVQTATMALASVVGMRLAKLGRESV